VGCRRERIDHDRAVAARALTMDEVAARRTVARAEDGDVIRLRQRIFNDRRARGREACRMHAKARGIVERVLRMPSLRPGSAQESFVLRRHLAIGIDRNVVDLIVHQYLKVRVRRVPVALLSLTGRDHGHDVAIEPGMRGR
jgi:hypothetical protein